MKKRLLGPGTMLAPVPAVMVSCAYGGKNNIITVAWTGIVNSNPPMVYISVRKSRYSHDLIKKSGEFVINLVTEDLQRSADLCGVRSGRDTDKFKACGLSAAKASRVGTPLIEESPVNLECKVVEVHEYGSHDMFVAEVVAVDANDELFDDTGRLCLEKAGLTTFSHGEYFALKARPLGRFGYSVMKPKTRRRINRESNERKRRRKR